MRQCIGVIFCQYLLITWQVFILFINFNQTWYLDLPLDVCQISTQGIVISNTFAFYDNVLVDKRNEET